MSTAAALHAGREVTFLATGLGRLMVRVPIAFAVLAWLAFSVFTGFSKGLSANVHETREIRADCGVTGCEPGTGAVIMTNTYDHTRTIAAMDQGAARSLQLASVFTVGALAVAVFSLFGGTRREARQRRRYMGAAVDHVKDGRARAERDVEGAKARLGKVGERRQKQVGRRWARQVAAGEVPTELGPVDRWIFRQAKPPKAQRKAKRAAKKVGKASEKAEQVTLDAEWATELAAVEAPTLLSPFDGPPLSPVQREEYAARQVDEAAAARERLAIDTADLFDRSTP